MASSPVSVTGSVPAVGGRTPTGGTPAGGRPAHLAHWELPPAWRWGLGETWIGPYRHVQEVVDAFGRSLALVTAPDPAHERWLFAEAAHLAHRSHAAIPATFHYWALVGGVQRGPGYLRRWIGGGSVASHLRRNGPADIPDVLELLRAIGSALGYLHARGEVHGAVGADSVWLTPTQRPWLMHWQWAVPADERPAGLEPAAGAPRAPEWGGRSTATTSFVEPPTGAVSMTSAMPADDAGMAPGMTPGEAGWAPTPESDQWQLGAMAYHALTGEPLPVLTAAAAVLPPVTLLRPDCPPSVAALVERMLASVPAERFPSIVALLRALDALVPATTFIDGGGDLRPYAANPMRAPASPAVGVDAGDVASRTSPGASTSAASTDGASTDGASAAAPTATAPMSAAGAITATSPRGPEGSAAVMTVSGVTARVNRELEQRLRWALGGDYAILHQLGAGASGSVWRARDLRLGREVAIKVLHPHLAADAVAMAQFRREARLAAALKHPALVPVYDWEVRAGMQVLVMELADQGSLAQRLAALGPRPIEELVDGLPDVLEALAVAHDAGVIHRDIKPENILLGAGGLWRVADLGIAGGLAGQMTAPGGIDPRGTTGTPAFAAPEQLLGEPQTPATDCYAVAALAWTVLTGMPPFGDGEPAQILARQLTGQGPGQGLRRASGETAPERMDAGRAMPGGVGLLERVWQAALGMGSRKGTGMGHAAGRGSGRGDGSGGVARTSDSQTAVERGAVGPGATAAGAGSAGQPGDGIPGPVRAWIARGLRPDPAERFPDARAMHDAWEQAWRESVGEFARGATTSTAGSVVPGRRVRWMARVRALIPG